MEILKDKYTITELSERLKVTDHALRYYEKEFNIVIPKDERGRRYYTPELANLMYQIKNMRDDGLEIKAIRKILQSDQTIGEPPPVVIDENSISLVTLNNTEQQKISDSNEIKQFFEDFKQQLTTSVTAEVASTKEHVTREITKSKLELGACVENGIRKLESKMEKHFQDVDRSIESWRSRNSKNLLKRIFRSIIR